MQTTLYSEYSAVHLGQTRSVSGTLKSVAPIQMGRRGEESYLQKMCTFTLMKAKGITLPHKVVVTNPNSIYCCCVNLLQTKIMLSHCKKIFRHKAKNWRLHKLVTRSGGDWTPPSHYKVTTILREETGNPTSYAITL